MCVFETHLSELYVDAQKRILLLEAALTELDIVSSVAIDHVKAQERIISRHLDDIADLKDREEAAKRDLRGILEDAVVSPSDQLSGFGDLVSAVALLVSMQERKIMKLEGANE